MRYLLVAPHVERARSDSRAFGWTTLPPRATRVRADPAVTVEFREQARVNGYDMLFLVVDTDGTERSVDELEERLSAVAHDGGRTSDVESIRLRWVARIHLSADVEDAEIWPSAHHETVELGDGGVLTIGWGSGRIDGWDGLDPTTQLDVLQGLAEAQALWCELEDLIASSSGDLISLYKNGSRVDADRILARLADTNAALQLHTLAWSEISRGVRVRPRAVARATLDAWDYPGLRAQVDADIEAAMSHAHVLERLAGARYQRAVELVLLALTVVSALGLVLGLIDLAYTVVASGGQTDSLLGAVRAADANVLVLVSGLALLLVLVMLVSSRRRPARRP